MHNIFYLRIIHPVMMAIALESQIKPFVIKPQFVFASLLEFCPLVESESYCRRVLAQRQKDGLLPKCPIQDDVRTVSGSEARALGATGVGGGFPCQAGLRLGCGHCTSCIDGFVFPIAPGFDDSCARLDI